MSQRFYTNCPLALGAVSLEGAEAHHLASVCRIRLGDRVCLFNGDGAEYPAVVTDVDRRHVSLDVIERQMPDRELRVPLEMAAPLPKGDRLQFLIEKLTELGVTRFVPLLCERSVIHPREGKLDKLERYVIEACKQCGRNRLMAIEPPAKWRAYLEPQANEVRLLAHPGGGRVVRPDRLAATSVRVAVGPEGGFTDAEIEEARQAGWNMVDMGPRILRIETAAIILAGMMTQS